MTTLGKVTDCRAIVAGQDCIERNVPPAQYCNSCRNHANPPSLLEKSYQVLSAISLQWDERHLEPDFFTTPFELRELVADLRRELDFEPSQAILAQQAKAAITAISKLRLTFEGDSNDAEHDAALELVSEVESLLRTLAPSTKVSPALIVCPSCGYDGQRPGNNGDGFRYLEDIVAHRKVLGIKAGQLRVASHYETGEGYDDGTGPRLECRNCLEEFPLPTSSFDQVEWVDTEEYNEPRPEPKSTHCNKLWYAYPDLGSYYALYNGCLMQLPAGSADDMRQATAPVVSFVDDGILVDWDSLPANMYESMVQIVRTLEGRM